jgi:hypothetical protein
MNENLSPYSDWLNSVLFSHRMLWIIGKLGWKAAWPCSVASILEDSAMRAGLMTFLRQKDFKGDRKLAICATRINKNMFTYLRVLLHRKFDFVASTAAYFEMYYGSFRQLFQIIDFWARGTFCLGVSRSQHLPTVRPNVFRGPVRSTSAFGVGLTKSV